MKSWVVAAAAIVLSANTTAALAAYAVRTGPNINDGRMLPNTSEQAEASFGPVGKQEETQIAGALVKLRAYAAPTSALGWDGPALDAFTGPAPTNYSGLSRREIQRVFKHISLYKPMNIGPAGGANCVVVLANFGRSEQQESDAVAIVFAFKDKTLSRIVFNFKPWIEVSLLQQERGAVLNG